MLLRQIVSYLLNHRWYSLAVVLLFSALPLASFLAVAFLLLVTLREGPLKALQFFVHNGYFPLIKLLWFGDPNSLYFNFLAGDLVGFILGCVLRETQSWAKTLQAGGHLFP